MSRIGSSLANDMTETATSVHEISSNIDSVKQRTVIQAESVSQTANMVEGIMQTIKQEKQERILRL